MIISGVALHAGLLDRGASTTACSYSAVSADSDVGHDHGCMIACILTLSAGHICDRKRLAVTLPQVMNWA